LTKFGSTAEEKGDVRWNKMSFEPVRVVNGDEAELILAKIAEIKEGIAGEKGQYAGAGPVQAEGESDEDFAARKEALRKF
jgi:hypothetical protein